MSSFAFLPKFVAGFRLGIHAVQVRFLALLAGSASGLLETQVRPARAQQFGARLHGRLPIEDEPVFFGSDNHHVSSACAAAHQLFLNTNVVELIRKEADGLIVIEVRLAHPSLGFRPAHKEEVFSSLGALGNSEGVCTCTLATAGAQDNTRAFLNLGLGGAGLLDRLREGERERPQALVGGGGNLEHRQATRLEDPHGRIQRARGLLAHQSC